MATTEDPETLADVLRQAHDLEQETTPATAPTTGNETTSTAPLPAQVVLDSLHARARVEEKPRTPVRHSTPVGDELRRRAARAPDDVARALWDALGATRTTYDRGTRHVEADHAVRMRAADSILNRTEGMPVTRTELTGADGGPLTLQALLAADVRDTE